MIVLDMEQGSPEWLAARIGRPTASQFNRILTSKRLDYSSQAEGYLNQLLADWLLGYPTGWEGDGWTERGTELEEEARAFYEFERGVDVARVGLVLREDGKVGGSPDGLVEATLAGHGGGVLEIKCPAIYNHIGYLRSPASLADAYRHQLQGLLYLTGRAWADVVSYCPDLPTVVVRVEPDAAYHAALAAALDTFVAALDAAKEQLADYKREPPRWGLAEELNRAGDLSALTEEC